MRSMNASRRDLLSSKMDFSQMMKNCAASVPALPVMAMNGSAWDNSLTSLSISTSFVYW